ncbi:hypothetical protein N431DRAFT_503500 [Stipitochalara longipes BDJ]|nr:hypothetical protein N431DRAFT_503500 [Stipitochalara longipes BDJ]
MAVIQIIHFGVESSLNQHATSIIVDDRVQKTLKALKGVEEPRHFALGVQVQDKGAVQITLEWTGVQDYMNLASTPEPRTFIESVSVCCGEPQSVFHVSLDKSSFGPDGPATANAVEYVQVYFPASRATSEFQKQIEGDFSSFEEIFRKGAKGDLSLAVGWRAKRFFVVRGWESMDRFEQSVKYDAYEEAIPTLFAWNAPFKMWHVERKVADDFEVVA